VSAPRACVCSSCPAHPAGVSAPPACGFYPCSSLTDAQWAIIEPLLPAPGNTAGRGGRPEKHSRRLVLDAIFYLVRGGIARRQLPVGFPPPTTVYDRFRAWAKAGVWQAVHDALRDLVRVYEGRDPQPCGCQIVGHLTRPASIRRSGHRDDLAALPGCQPRPPVVALVQSAVSVPTSGVGDASGNGRHTRPPPTADDDARRRASDRVLITRGVPCRSISRRRRSPVAPAPASRAPRHPRRRRPRRTRR
jgi:transposase